MAEKKTFKNPRPAKDLKASDARQTWAEGPKKKGPAKDVKPGSEREKAAKGLPKKKPASGNLTSERRFSDVKKSRGPFGQLTVRKDNLPDVKREPSRAVVKYEPPKPDKAIAGGILRTAAKVGVRSLGPVGALIGMTSPAGEGSDKPSGPLMKGNAPKGEAASTKSMEKAYQAIGTKTGTDAPVRAVRRAIPIPQPKPDLPKKAGKSSVRAAFEKEFAKNRKAGKKAFDFRGKKYSTKLK